jgi:hypothetical protein
MKRNKDRKKFKDTGFGKWVKEKFPDVLDTVGDLTGIEALNVVSDLIEGRDMNASDRVEYEVRMNLELERLKEEQGNVTERWKYDMEGDAKLAKVIRPIMLIALVSIFLVLAVLDSIEAVHFEVKGSYIQLLELLLLSAFGAYFVGRTVEKRSK